MRYNLLLTNVKTCEIVFDKWFNSCLDDAIDMFMNMRDYIGVGYWLHLVDEDGDIRCQFMKEE